MTGRCSSQRATLALLLLCAASLTCSSAASAGLRGVDPAKASLYAEAQASGTFSCFDGSKTVPASALNDNYCDCPDGSDEPGARSHQQPFRERLQFDVLSIKLHHLSCFKIDLHNMNAPHALPQRSENPAPAVMQAPPRAWLAHSTAATGATSR